VLNSAQVNKPTRIIYAQVFLYTGLVLGLAGILIGPVEWLRHNDVPMYLGFVCNPLMGPLIAFLVFMVGRRRNWARITVAIVIGFGLTLALLEALEAPGYVTKNPFSLIVPVLQIVGVSLLFGKNASTWFKSRKARVSEDTLVDISGQGTPSGMPMDISQTSEAPLLVIKFRTFGQIVLGFFTLLLLFILLYCVFIIPVTATSLLQLVVEEILVIFVTLVIALFFLEQIIAREIRLYKDRIVQVWWVLGQYELFLRDAKLVDGPGYRGKTRILINRKTKFPLLHKGIWYFAPLIDARDVDRLNRLLADLSGRDIKEFEQFSANMERLIQKES
jgi:hypothetical protein